MHQSSLDNMQAMIDRHLDALTDALGRPGTAFDIGSYDINGSYKPLITEHGWAYQGLDIEPGLNVDRVMASPYRLPIRTGEADLILSGQAFEHIEYFWVTFLEMVRALRPGGMIFLLAPSRGPEHRHPVDCWRFYRDGFEALARWGQVELVEAATAWQPVDYGNGDADWGDTIGVFRLRRSGPAQRLKDRARAAAARLLAARRDPGDA